MTDDGHRTHREIPLLRLHLCGHGHVNLSMLVQLLIVPDVVHVIFAQVYSPLRHYGLDKPGMKLGVVGLGGLGHMCASAATRLLHT